MPASHDCPLCPRLAAYRAQQKANFPDYHCQPVAAFGDNRARLLIVGLAPGLHGANASGRPFTGDASGKLLFAALHDSGFASRAEAVAADDAMRLCDCRITNAVKCLPPANRPNAAEINSCNRFLREEISALRRKSVLLALGTVAHRAIVRALELRQAQFKFGHAAEHDTGRGLLLIDCIHPSRYNQNTGKIDAHMLGAVFGRIRQLLH